MFQNYSYHTLELQDRQSLPDLFANLKTWLTETIVFIFIFYNV